MTNPYATLAQAPELLFYYVAVALIAPALLTCIAAWVFVSYRKMWSWYTAIKASSGRWENLLFPPEDLTGDIAAFLFVGAINVALIGGAVFLLGLFVYMVV